MVIYSAEAVRAEIPPPPQPLVTIEPNLTRPIMRKENTFIATEYRSSPITDQPKVAEYRRIATAQRAAKLCTARDGCQR